MSKMYAGSEAALALVKVLVPEPHTNVVALEIAVTNAGATVAVRRLDEVVATTYYVGYAGLNREHARDRFLAVLRQAFDMPRHIVEWSLHIDANSFATAKCAYELHEPCADDIKPLGAFTLTERLQ